MAENDVLIEKNPWQGLPGTDCSYDETIKLFGSNEARLEAVHKRIDSCSVYGPTAKNICAWRLLAKGKHGCIYNIFHLLHKDNKIRYKEAMRLFDEYGGRFIFGYFARGEYLKILAATTRVRFLYEQQCTRSFITEVCGEDYEYLESIATSILVIGDENAELGGEAAWDKKPRDLGEFFCFYVDSDNKILRFCVDVKTYMDGSPIKSRTIRDLRTEINLLFQQNNDIDCGLADFAIRAIYSDVGISNYLAGKTCHLDIRRISDLVERFNNIYFETLYLPYDHDDHVIGLRWLECENRLFIPTESTKALYRKVYPMYYDESDCFRSFNYESDERAVSLYMGHSHLDMTLWAEFDDRRREGERQLDRMTGFLSALFEEFREYYKNYKCEEFYYFNDYFKDADDPREVLNLPRSSDEPSDSECSKADRIFRKLEISGNKTLEAEFNLTSLSSGAGKAIKRLEHPYKSLMRENITLENLRKFFKFIDDLRFSDIYSYFAERIVGHGDNLKKACFYVWMYLKSFLVDQKQVHRNNFIISGCSGCGKTEFMRTLKSFFEDNVTHMTFPVVRLDTTMVTETGWKGADLEDELVSALYPHTGNLGYGVVFLDEFDKKLMPRFDSSGSDVTGSFQSNMLTALEGNIVYSERRGLGINTECTLFVGLGTFDEARNRKSAKVTSVGFSDIDLSTAREDVYWNDVTVDDVLEQGAKDELVGRFTDIINFRPLSMESLRIIVKRYLDNRYVNNDIVSRFVNNVVYKDEFVESVAKLGYMNHRGAREPLHVLEGLLTDVCMGLAMDVSDADRKVLYLNGLDEEGHLLYDLHFESDT